MSYLPDTATPDHSLQILEVRAPEGERPLTITAAIGPGTIQAICTALSEQLARHGQEPTEKAEEVLKLRERSALVDRLQPLADADAHAFVGFSYGELCTCLVELTRYVQRADGQDYRPPDLRERLQVIGRIFPILSDAEIQASTVAAAASEESNARSAA
jgi:hypothetical protein